MFNDGGFDSPLALLSSPLKLRGFVMVCFEWTDFMWKWGKVNEFLQFQDTRRNHLPELYCVLMHTKSVCFVMWVLLCARACTSLGPAVAHGGQPERIAWDFLTTSAELFEQKHLMNRLWRSVTCLSVSDPCSCTDSGFAGVSLWFLREFDACRMAPKPQTPIPDELRCQPASKSASKSANDQTLPYQYCSLFLLCMPFSLSLFFKD